MSNANVIAQIQTAHDAGQVSIAQARGMLAAVGADPDSLLIACEGGDCTNRIKFGDAHSLLSVYATTGTTGIAAFRCDDAQHYGCSPECAAQAHARCVREHLLPALHAKRGDL